jgi:hypothetical protein
MASTVRKELKELREFVAFIARMTKDGERVNGREYIQEGDDAIATLGRLIHDARTFYHGRK